MAAVTRWVEYDVGATSSVGGGSQGTRGYKESTLSIGDTFNINNSNNRLYVALDGGSTQTLVLTSGTNLDPRFVAKNISELLHDITGDTYQYAQCEWRLNKFRLYSGTIGSSSAVTVSSGTNSAHLTLGFSEGSGVGGSNNPSHGGSYTFSGNITVSGTWEGFFDETYHIMIGTNDGIGNVTKGGSNSYTGTMDVGGIFWNNNTTAYTYTIQIDTSNGTTLGAGAGNVPRYKVVAGGGLSDDYPSDWTDILYPDYWYPVGTHGVKVKWSDAVFNTCNPAWTINVQAPSYAAGTNTTAPVGTAQYVWTSSRGDDSGDSAITTVSGGFTRLGTRGLYIKFNGTGDLAAREDYFIMCRAPQPSAYGITQLNYGNVTVSTESPVKAVVFEIKSGAAQLSSVKFGLQSHGTFQHHDANNNDTYFRFGTVGPGNPAGVAPTSGKEWRTNVVAADISNDTPPAYLHATKGNLSEVSSADASEDVGNTQQYLMSDPIWLCIRLGADETGANSTINYRLYFDYA